MRSLKRKCLLILSIVMIIVLSISGCSYAAQRKSSRKSAPAAKSSAAPKKSATQKKADAPKKSDEPVTSDDILGEEMLRLAEALKKTSQLEHGIPSSEEEREKLYEQYDAEIAEIEK